MLGLLLSSASRRLGWLVHWRPCGAVRDQCDIALERASRPPIDAPVPGDWEVAELHIGSGSRRGTSWPRLCRKGELHVGADSTASR